MEWNEKTALEVSRQVVGGGAGEAQLLRLALTAAVRIDNLVVKVVRPGHRDLSSLEREWDILRFVHEQGLAVCEPLIAPAATNGYLTMASRYLPADPGAELEWGVVGKFLLRLHALAPPLGDFSRPRVREDDSERYLSRLAELRQLGRITAAEDSLLRTILRDTAIPDLSADSVLCHCDIQDGNMIISRERLFVIDWEGAQWGNRLLDLAKIVGRRERYGLKQSEYQAFCSAYGQDPVLDERIVAIRRLAEVAGISYLLLSPGLVQQQEGRKRLDDLTRGTQTVWVDR